MAAVYTARLAEGSLPPGSANFTIYVAPPGRRIVVRTVTLSADVHEEWLSLNLRTPGGFFPVWVYKAQQYLTAQLDTRHVLYAGNSLELSCPTANATYLVTGFDFAEEP